MERNSLSGSPGWRSRGYIPHFDQPNLIQSITIRLYDAVPDCLISRWKAELRWTPETSRDDPRRRALRKQIESYEDAGHGACWLADNRIAGLAQSSLLHFDAKRYQLLAWCIMPNHVHSVIELLGGYSLDEVLHSFKSYTAHKANEILHRSGGFWFREYYDRYIRNEQHLADTLEYVENNPVKAGLVRAKEWWEWTSARDRVDCNAAGTAALPGRL
jgi:REP element-mobilizing transposase RayT